MWDAVLVGAGCFCFGALLGGIVVHYIVRVQEFSLRGLTGSVAIFGGAGVIALFRSMGDVPHLSAVWWYPIGLLVGGVIVAALAWEAGKARS